MHHFNGQLEGIRGGCSVTITTLKSTLSCWFQKKCLKDLDRLLSSFNISILQPASALDPSLPIAHAIDQFLNETFFSIDLLSKSKFDNQINDDILQFQRRTVTKYSEILQLFREVLNENAFVSSYGLNWYWERGVNENIDRVLTHAVMTINGCLCGTRSDCTSSAATYNDGSREYSIPGWNIGCSVVETLLRSTMICLYDRHCLSTLIFYLGKSSHDFRRSINVSALDFSNSSRFEINTLIQNIANELFIEQWETNISYSSFYKQCAPLSCSYESVPNDYTMYTVYEILGLYGGLRIVLRLFIPLLVKLVLKIRNRFRTNSVTPND
ncbi:hypothetical protein I4U23_013317 [Adineta vaga]|nr:hypothetical protein I4U23_013317 [Adineta vaga]